MTASTLKIIAIIAMTFNHIAHVFGAEMPDWLYFLFMMPGGLTFPIMAYFMSEGYRYTSNFKRYAGRLLIFALISLFPYIYALDASLNVLFTLLLGLFILYLSDPLKSNTMFHIAFLIAILISYNCDWGLIGVPMILYYHRYRESRIRRVIIPLIFIWSLTLLFIISSFIEPDLMNRREMVAQALCSFVGCSASIPLLLSYNGQKGRSLKYLFYLYYPAHLIVLGLLHQFLL